MSAEGPQERGGDGSSRSPETPHRLFRTGRLPVDPTLCFVLMPFAARFDEVWEDAIKVAVAEVGLRCVRADDIYGPQSIMGDIWEQINWARVLVADMTGKNPNVFYELGLAHALGKDVISLVKRIDDAPFNLWAWRVIVYGTSGRSMAKLRMTLVAYPREALTGGALPIATAPQTVDQCSEESRFYLQPWMTPDRGALRPTTRELVRNALGMRPTRIVIGEVRGAEALNMLLAMNMGHEGSLDSETALLGGRR